MKRTLLASLLFFSCANGQQGPPPAPPPVPVSVVTLEPHLIDDTSDYLATLTSRRSVNLYPQVSGYVRSIAVTAGTVVKAGTVLLQIDASAEQAALQNLVATRESLAVSAALARERLERSTTLRADGIVSQESADQTRAQADQAQASLRGTDALIASQRARVGFFSIVAPFEGEVGHVPVKVGDFVTPAMMLTSLTQDAGLEAEVWVPVDKVPLLSGSSRVRLLDAAGELLAESAVVFVSPRADPTSQLVLIKGAFAANGALRADQLVRARVVWQQAPGLSVPAAAVMREAGQPFAFVVEAADAGLAARRVPVALGVLQGGDYVVTRGLDAGQRVVESGLQQLHDGAPVQLQGADAGSP